MRKSPKFPSVISCPSLVSHAHSPPLFLLATIIYSTPRLVSSSLPSHPQASPLSSPFLLLSTPRPSTAARRARRQREVDDKEERGGHRFFAVVGYGFVGLVSSPCFFSFACLWSLVVMVVLSLGLGDRSPAARR
ncbi:hypothetical protein Dimus_037937 [Dionaea muscipula]